MNLWMRLNKYVCFCAFLNLFFSPSLLAIETANLDNQSVESQETYYGGTTTVRTADTLAIPPVRLAITAETGSGIEQDIADYIAGHFEGALGATVSTVNPDWYVKCKIIDNQDRQSGQIRYNGTVTVTTTDGQLVCTVSVQKYNQDYSEQPGTPLNKKLVDSTAKEVINVVGDRANEKIAEAVEIELQARGQIAKVESFAKKDKYGDAIAALKVVGRDSVHFQSVQKTIAQYEMEKKALFLVQGAEVKAKHAQYGAAISLLKDVDVQSKRYKLSKQLTNRYRNLFATAPSQGKAKK